MDVRVARGACTAAIQLSTVVSPDTFLGLSSGRVTTGKTPWYDTRYITIHFVLRSKRPDQAFFGITSDNPTFDDIVKLYHQYQYN